MTRESGKERIIELFKRSNWGAEELLSIALKIETHKEASFQNVIIAASQSTGSSYFEILGRSRKRKIVIARMLCYFYLRESGYTLAYIGEKFGRNHATVLHNLRQLEDDIKTNFRPTIDYLKEFNQLLTD